MERASIQDIPRQLAVIQSKLFIPPTQKLEDFAANFCAKQGPLWKSVCITWLTPRRGTWCQRVYAELCQLCYHPEKGAACTTRRPYTTSSHGCTRDARSGDDVLEPYTTETAAGGHWLCNHVW